MSNSSLSSQDYLILADIVGAYGIKGWVRLRVRLDDPNLLLTLPNLQLSLVVESAEHVHSVSDSSGAKAPGQGFYCLSGWCDRPDSGRGAARP